MVISMRSEGERIQRTVRATVREKIVRHFRQVFYVSMVTMVICFSSQIHSVQAKTETKQAVKEITGEIGYLDKEYISIVYNRDMDNGKEYEAMFIIDDSVGFEGVRDMRGLQEHDLVEIKYIENEQGGKKKRIARLIFLKEKKIPSLNLKGFKE